MMEQVGRAIERLLSDESLTADVDDAAAKALLRWGEEQIKAGRPADTVGPAVKALARLVGRRTALSPAEARARLEQAHVLADETALASLWTETLPDGEWAEKLLRVLTPTPPVTPAAPPTPLPPSPSAPVVEREVAAAGVRGEEGKWWRRLFFWRRKR